MSVYLQAIERAIESRVNETLNAEFQRGVERGKFDQRQAENAELADLRAKLAKTLAAFREIAAWYEGDATGCNAQLLLDKITAKVEELEKEFGNG